VLVSEPFHHANTEARREEFGRISSVNLGSGVLGVSG
jgi:hypothetical protein